PQLNIGTISELPKPNAYVLGLNIESNSTIILIQVK
ncbi:unnamed protein product, partial [Rotaria sp. Silwood2]